MGLGERCTGEVRVVRNRFKRIARWPPNPERCLGLGYDQTHVFVQEQPRGAVLMFVAPVPTRDHAGPETMQEPVVRAATWGSICV